MHGDLVDRSIRTSLLATAVSFPFLIVYVGSLWSVGFALASLWSTANLWMISMVVREYFGPRRWVRLGFLLGVKFPILYGLGIWGLSQRAVPGLSVLLGFHMIFLILVLKVISRRVFVPEGGSYRSTRRGTRASGNEEST